MTDVDIALSCYPSTRGLPQESMFNTERERSHVAKVVLRCEGMKAVPSGVYIFLLSVNTKCRSRSRSLRG